MQTSVVTGWEDTYLKVPLFSSHPMKTLLHSMRSTASPRHLRTQKPSPHFLSCLLPLSFRLRQKSKLRLKKVAVSSTLRQNRGAESPARPARPAARPPRRLGRLPSTGHAPIAREGAASPGPDAAQHCPPSGSSSGRARELQLMLRGAREYGRAPVPGASTGCAQSEETKPCLAPEETAVSSVPSRQVLTAGQGSPAAPVSLRPRCSPRCRCLSRGSDAAPGMLIPLPRCWCRSPRFQCLSRSAGAAKAPVPSRRALIPTERPAPLAGSPAYWLRGADLHGGAPPPPGPPPLDPVGRCPAPVAARRGESPPRGCREAWARWAGPFLAIVPVDVSWLFLSSPPRRQEGAFRLCYSVIQIAAA